MRRSIITSFLALLLVLATAVPSAGGSGRVVHVTDRDYYEAVVVQNGLPNPLDPINDPSVSWACDFPVQVIWQGTWLESTYFDRNGDWVKTIGTDHGSSITFVSLESGEAIWSPYGGPTIFTPGPTEDTWLLTRNGVGGRLVVPGAGLIRDATDVGRIVAEFRGDWEFVELLFMSGLYPPDAWDDPWPYVCEALG